MAIYNKIFKFSFFGWFFYFCKEKLVFQYANQPGRAGLKNRMNQLRNRRYRRKKGCCEHCGQHFDKNKLQMHHIFQYSKFPKWKRENWNVIMLCPQCHYLYHNDITLQVKAMQRTAEARGFDLKAVCYQAAMKKWKEAVWRQ